MKRILLLAIPAASVGVGLLLVLWHGATRDRPRDTGRTTTEAAPGAGRETAPVVEPSGLDASPKLPPGGLRFFVHSQGKGLEAADVILIQDATGKHMDFKTKAGGTETVSNLPPGEYRIVARHPKHTLAKTRVQVESDKLKDVSLELVEGSLLRGAVIEAGRGPLPDASVTLLETAKRKSLNGPTVKTDEKGQYLIEGIAPGQYRVRFRHEHLRPWQKEDLIVNGPGEVHEVNAVLKAGSTILGRVLDEEGKPIPKAMVVATNEETSAIQCDSEGRFTLYGLGDQAIHCFATMAGYTTVFKQNIPPNSSDVEFRLGKSATVSGNVIADPMPPRFMVNLSRYHEGTGKAIPLRNREFDNPPGGVFEIPEVPPGSYRIEIQSHGYKAIDVPEITVQAGETVSNIQVRLRRTN